MPLDFLGYLVIFGGAFIYGLTGALTPGPVLTAVIKETPKRIKRGYLVGPTIIVGHAILEIAIIILAFYGLLSLIQIPLIYFIISTVGGGILIILAVLLFYDLKTKEITLAPNLKVNNQNDKKQSLILQGIILSISNPFWILWWGTSGFTYMFYLFEQVSTFGLDLEFLYSLGLISIDFSWIATYFIGHIMSDFIWYTFISVSIYAGKQAISDKAYKIILICCGVFFSYLGIKFITLAIFPLLEPIFII